MPDHTDRQPNTSTDKLRTAIRLLREALNAAEDALDDIELDADGGIRLDETTFNGIIAELRHVSSTVAAPVPTSRKTRTNRSAGVRRRRKSVAQRPSMYTRDSGKL